MKKLFLIALGFVGMTSYAQTTQNDTTFLKLNDETVGYINKTYFVQYVGNDSKKDKVSDITLTRPLTKSENESLMFQIPNSVGKVDYDFKLPSDYLKQSSIIGDRAIKTKIVTSVIGIGLGVIGGIIAAKPSYSTTTTYVETPKYDYWGNYVGTQLTPVTTQTPNKDNLAMGLVITGLGTGVGLVGYSISVQLDLEANKLLRKGADKFRVKGL